MTNIFDQNSYFANLLGHPVYDDAFLSWFEMYEERCANNSWKTKMFHSIVTSNKNFCWNVSQWFEKISNFVFGVTVKGPSTNLTLQTKNFSSEAASALFWGGFFSYSHLHIITFFVQFDWLFGQENWKKKIRFFVLFLTLKFN